MSGLEDTFRAYVEALAPDLAARMVAQYPIAPGRKYRLDYAFVEERLGLELQGGLWARGAHSRPRGILRDMEKANFAALNGWRLLFYATQHIEDDPMTVIAEIRQMLARSEVGA